MLNAPLCVLNLQHTNSASYNGNAEKSNPHKHRNQICMGFKFDYQVLLEFSCGFDLSLLALLTITS